MQTRCPRLLIAGTSGDSGKTVVTLGLLLALRRRGILPVAFKKGPDYIDSAWLSWAAGLPCRNLDTFLQPGDRILESFVGRASAEINLIEGNRGLLDGMDLEGTHSSASLARLLDAPVVLVVNASKMTRTVAAAVVGCRQLEPDLQLGGVILNRVAGDRHESLARRAVEQLAGVPVLGAMPRLREQLLPDRHLGLLPPQEHEQLGQTAERIREVVGQNVDLDRLVELARSARALPMEAAGKEPPSERGPTHARVRLGVFQDSSFTFYYPENLEALEQAGAELVPVSGLSDPQLPPDLHGLYIGGGFPETHAARLSDNQSLGRELRRAAAAGLPIYAECGGLIYLARSLQVGAKRYPMAGVLPLEVELCSRPVGHGYVELTVQRPNPFFAPGLRLTGHEFHYTRIVGELPPDLYAAFEVRRGTGSGGGRDGIVHNNVLASYTHLHALGAPEWATGLVDRAASWRASRSATHAR